MSVLFLATMSPEQARQSLLKFPPAYMTDWRLWQCTYRASSKPTAHVVSVFGCILRRWQAARPRCMRRPRSEAKHEGPFLDDLVCAAWPHVRLLGNLDVRDMDKVLPGQKAALVSLWNLFRNLSYPDECSCVGITKAVMLLTEGRIGPAFDRNVRKTLHLQPQDGESWLNHLRDIGQDIRAFERKYGVALESLVSKELAPLNVGRVYDMIAGPRRRPY